MESVIRKMPGQRVGESVRSGADDDNAVSTLGRGDAGRVKRLREMMTGRGKTLLSYTVVFLILIAGWNKRGDVYLSPEEGMGYALGIIGGVRNLPWLFTATFVALLAAIPFYGFVVSRSLLTMRRKMRE